jgi:hypothetical protein
MSTNEEKPRSFEPFELAAAILLGIGAIAASIAGYQEGLWGGQSVEAYGDAAAQTTRASSTYNDELSTYNLDSQVDIRAKELIWEALENPDGEGSARKQSMASWMLITQLSETAYNKLGLPAATRKQYWDGDVEGAELTAEELEAALNTDLDQTYVDEVFGSSGEEFDAAEKRFAEGSQANAHGDQFSLAGVIFTVALFFAGLSLIFKSNMRWGFLGMGAVIWIAAMIYMLGLTWAS